MGEASTVDPKKAGKSRKLSRQKVRRMKILEAFDGLVTGYIEERKPGDVHIIAWEDWAIAVDGEAYGQGVIAELKMLRKRIIKTYNDSWKVAKRKLRLVHVSDWVVEQATMKGKNGTSARLAGLIEEEGLPRAYGTPNHSGGLAIFPVTHLMVAYTGQKIVPAARGSVAYVVDRTQEHPILQTAALADIMLPARALLPGPADFDAAQRRLEERTNPPSAA